MFSWSAVIIVCAVAAGDTPAPQGGTASRTIVEAVDLGLRIVERASRSYPKHRQCFSCHHQTLPMLAMVTARDAGWTIDNALLAEQLAFTRKSFRARLDGLREGKGIGGRAMTVGYGLWALDLVGAEPDEVTDALAAYLLKLQEPDGKWRPSSFRPPMGESKVSCTVLSAYGLLHFTSESQQSEATVAIDKAKHWLASAPLESQEDKVGRLWGLALLGGNDDDLERARHSVLNAQREDGGWSQVPDMASDAYATGQTLWVLLQTGHSGKSTDSQRGVNYLLNTQQEDGSWFVQTRAKPVQVFFDNGDPHGTSQFISVSATGWAVAALALAESAH